MLNGNKFDPESVMPICLPPNDKFNDTGREATAVGVGIIKSMEFQGVRSRT